MTVIQQDGPDNYRVLDTIHTHYGAHTLTADPVSHKVFVAYASLLAHPRIAVFCPTPTAPEENVAPVIQQDVHEDQQSRLSPVRANVNLPPSDKCDKSLTVQIPIAESNTTCTQALVIPGMNYPHRGP